MRRHERTQDFDDLPILGELREHLVRCFASAEQPRRHVVPRRRWSGGRRPLVLFAVLVVLGGSATAAATLSALLFPGEPPLPATARVLASGYGPDHQRYVLAVRPSKCPGWAHLELRSTTTFTTGGCGRPINTKLSPRPSTGSCGSQVAIMVGTVSARAQTVRATFANGSSSTTSVYAFPANVGIGAGAFVLFYTPSQGKLVTLQALDANGRTLGSWSVTPMTGCYG